MAHRTERSAWAGLLHEVLSRSITTERHLQVIMYSSSAYSLNTNISIVEPAHIIQKALIQFRKAQPIDVSALLTLAEQRAKYPKPDKDTSVGWDTWVQS